MREEYCRCRFLSEAWRNSNPRTPLCRRRRRHYSFVSRRVNFTDATSGGTFRVSIGIGPVAALARHLSVASSHADWTLGQRRRVIGSAIRGGSALEPAPPEDHDGAGGRSSSTSGRYAYARHLYFSPIARGSRTALAPCSSANSFRRPPPEYTVIGTGYFRTGCVENRALHSQQEGDFIYSCISGRDVFFVFGRFFCLCWRRFDR